MASKPALVIILLLFYFLRERERIWRNVSLDATRNILISVK
jgi:predicted PurR-regulated permease PerM